MDFTERADEILKLVYEHHSKGNSNSSLKVPKSDYKLYIQAADYLSDKGLVEVLAQRNKTSELVMALSAKGIDYCRENF